jgi:hypothetical protein
MTTPILKPDGTYEIEKVETYEPSGKTDVFGGSPPKPSGVLRRILRGGPGSGHHGHAGRPGEVGGSAPAGSGSGATLEEISERFPLAGERVDGRIVRPGVPNRSSIESSMNDWDILKGIREVRMDQFQDYDPDDSPSFYSRSEKERTESLAQQIKSSKEISPLIVVVDNEEFPYILEGAHRWDALWMLGASSLPALVVIDRDLLPRPDVERGGPGSGHFDHAGRPGEVGGSAPEGSAAGERDEDPFYQKYKSRLDEGYSVYKVDVSTTDKAFSLLASDLPEDWHDQGVILEIDENESFAKDEIVRQISETSGLSYESVNARIKSWALASSETAIAQMLQEAAEIYLDSIYPPDVANLSSWQEDGEPGAHLEGARVFSENPEEITRNYVLAGYYDRIFEVLSDIEGTSYTQEQIEELMGPVNTTNKLIEFHGGDPAGNVAEARAGRDGYNSLAVEPFRSAGLDFESWKQVELMKHFSDRFQDHNISMDPNHPDNQAFARAMYENTQQSLSDNGITHVTLYRGMRLNNVAYESVQDALDNGNTPVIRLSNRNALESWSAGRHVAEAFRQTGRGERGNVLTATVPAERVFSTARSGFGCLNEMEFVVWTRDGDEVQAE